MFYDRNEREFLPLEAVPHIAKSIYQEVSVKQKAPLEDGKYRAKGNGR